VLVPKVKPANRFAQGTGMKRAAARKRPF